MRMILVILFMAVLFTGKTQEWKPLAVETFQEVLKKQSIENRKENYSIEFVRRIYSDVRDLTPVSVSRGKFLRGKGKEYRMESAGQILIQTSDIKMVLDSAEKIIYLMKPDTLFDQVNMVQLFNGEEFKSATYFYARESSQDKYKVLFTEGVNGYQRIEITLDQQTAALRKIDFYLVTANYRSEDFEDESLESPRIIVEYTPAVAVKHGAGIFELTYWFKKNKEKYELHPGMDFILEDLRIQTTH